MPFDAQGNFIRVMNWQDDAANDISILASRHDAEDDNFAAGFNDTVCRDGRAAMTGNLKMGSNKITGLADGTNSADGVNKGQLDALNTTLSTAINTAISNAFDNMFPVGAIFLGTEATCPMAALMPAATWTLVSAGCALWTGNGTAGSGTTTNANYANAPANTTIAAGAPNIKGDVVCLRNAGAVSFPNGAFYNSNKASTSNGTGDSATTIVSVSMDASRYNSIYGNSTTVQPPAYVVNVWRRTA